MAAFIFPGKLGLRKNEQGSFQSHDVEGETGDIALRTGLQKGVFNVTLPPHDLASWSMHEVSVTLPCTYCT